MPVTSIRLDTPGNNRRITESDLGQGWGSFFGSVMSEFSAALGEAP